MIEFSARAFSASSSFCALSHTNNAITVSEDFFLLNPCGDDVGLAQFFEPWKRRAIYAHALQAQQKGLVIHHHSRKTGIIFIQYTATLEDIYIGTNQRCIAPI